MSNIFLLSSVKHDLEIKGEHESIPIEKITLPGRLYRHFEKNIFEMFKKTQKEKKEQPQTGLLTTTTQRG